MGGPLADYQIVQLAEAGMITPFERSAVREVNPLLWPKPKTLRESFTIPEFPEMMKVISYGQSSYGYDARIADEFKLFHPYPGAVMDVKNPDLSCFLDIIADQLVIPAHGFLLARTIETFDIPTDVIVICVGKSSYARVGLSVLVTPLEPGWRGHVTLEIGNLTSVPCRIYANEGICQFIFLRGERQCEHTYATKNAGASGKYQDQRGIVASLA